jgi:outer membrane protein TolC
MGGANSLQIALAREELAEAHAGLDLAEVLWLPNLWAGVGYNKHEGALQETQGDVLQVSRNSGFVGGGIFASFDFADAMLEPRSALHDVDAASAGVSASVNDTLLAVAVAYNDLLEAQAGLTLAEENVSFAQELGKLTEAFSRSGQGLEADAARARNELAHRKRLVVAREQSVETRSARLATLLRLDPKQPLRASEPRLVPFALMPEDVELDNLVALAMDARPEIRSLTFGVSAEEAQGRQERLRPFMPRLVLGLRGGGLGGGTGSDFEDFSDEGQLTAGLVWGVRNLGFGESAVRRREAAQTRRAKVQLQLVRDAVAEEVTVAYLQARGRRRQVELAMQNVAESLDSLDLNMARIRGAAGLPIEALQAIQAAATARDTYLDAVGEFNRSQFLLLRAVGRAPRP